MSTTTYFYGEIRKNIPELSPNSSCMCLINPCPAEPGYTLPFQTVLIQISWFLKKPNDLDLQFVIQYVNLYPQSGLSNLIG